MCLSAIYWARLGSVFYANTRQDAARIDFDWLEFGILGQQLHDAAVALQAFDRDFVVDSGNDYLS